MKRTPLSVYEGVAGVLPEALPVDGHGFEASFQAEQDAWVEIADGDGEGVVEVVDLARFVADLAVGGEEVGLGRGLVEPYWVSGHEDILLDFIPQLAGQS